MSRPLRIEFPGALYHVTARGNARQDIFIGDGDREAFLSILAQAVERFGWLVHAYCLMGNHYHLIVETPQANLSRGMRHLNGVYTQRFNHRHGRPGHVFQGRYKAILVEKESYLLELCRYVALNPVRAGMVSRAENWPWSSYRATAGLAPSPPWLCCDWVLSCFAQRPKAAHRKFADFVAGKDTADIWECLQGQIYLGGEDFANEARGRLDADLAVSKEVPRQQKGPVKKNLAEFKGEAASSNEAMALAYESGAYGMAEIAQYFGVHYCTVSRAVKAREAGSGKDKC